MRAHSNFPASSVAARVRLGWILIAVLFVAVVWTSITGLRTMQRTQHTHGDQVILVVTQAEHVTRHLPELRSALAEWDASRDIEAHPEFVRSINGMLDALAPGLPATTAFQNVEEDLRSSLAGLDRLGQAMHGNVTRLAKQEREMLELGRALSETLNGHILGEMAELDALDARDGSMNLVASDRMSQVLTLIRYVELEHALERAIDGLGMLPTFHSIDNLDGHAESLALEIRDTLQGLGALPRTAFRDDLIQTVDRLQQGYFVEGGVISLHTTGLQIIEKRRLEFAKIDELLNGAEAAIAGSTALAKGRMHEAVQLIDDRAAMTTRRLLLLAGVVFLVVCLAVVFVFERQMIRRLRQLTRAAKVIASGNGDWELTVKGSDELGELAAALAIIQEHSNELRRSNEELGRFAYTASHDLKSPLRAIHELAEWTIEDEGEALSDGGRRKLGLLLHRAKRLDNLLDSLIDYSRVGRWRSGIKSVDLHWMMQDILDMLGATDRFTLNTVGTFKDVRTYDVPLRQVLQNFIDNAVKHHDRDHGEITVSFQTVGDRLFISISDDGPGIAPEYHGQVFELFKTLQSRDKVEGSGMGLAIVRKHIERYGGTLTVTSDPEKQRGTTFSFDWPSNEGCAQFDHAA